MKSNIPFIHSGQVSSLVSQNLCDLFDEICPQIKPTCDASMETGLRNKMAFYHIQEHILFIWEQMLFIWELRIRAIYCQKGVSVSGQDVSIMTKHVWVPKPIYEASVMCKSGGGARLRKSQQPAKRLSSQ